ncbi:hypothetical protein KM176_06180 [Pseudooceanicola sp. CBS1P-1]|uniref:Protein ImuA n=1 Tax=Pseudooceanicola albus TaxID=2692189 RepID=A0A6L7FYB4_9RHOB|nr:MULTISPECIES: hypothetical protein [Pseudooceanicola]MBT9383440.1 hypothetical protein [Pseudooceanicola endophyticus]MXN16238.1 hypothetical protein [Pseudooceanicola albus]
MSLDRSLLQRGSWQGAPELALGAEAGLRLARLHEACGAGRHAFAHFIGARALAEARARDDAEAPIYWISPAWNRAPLHAPGMAAFLDPGRVIFASPRRGEDLLWVLEEVLRSGLVPLAVAELDRLPTLTQVRRLHLAAEQGRDNGICAPLGLILTPGDGGAQGVESRWHVTPDHLRAERRLMALEHRLWRLERRRARMAPPRAWALHHHFSHDLALRDATGGFSLGPPLPPGPPPDMTVDWIPRPKRD